MNMSLRIEKFYAASFLLIGIVFSVTIPSCQEAFAVTPRYKAGSVVIRDFSVTNLPLTYGAGSEIFSAAADRANIALYNPAAAAIVGTTSTTANCVGATDQFFIPPGGSATYLEMKLNTRICLRYLGGALLASGTLLATIW